MASAGRSHTPVHSGRQRQHLHSICQLDCLSFWQWQRLRIFQCQCLSKQRLSMRNEPKIVNMDPSPPLFTVCCYGCSAGATKYACVCPAMIPCMPAVPLKPAFPQAIIVTLCLPCGPMHPSQAMNVILLTFELPNAPNDWWEKCSSEAWGSLDFIHVHCKVPIGSKRNWKSDDTQDRG